jgi:serine/threonine-protein kinase RsbW
MKPDRFEIELESKIDSLPVISGFIEDALNQIKAGPSDVYKVQLAVDEACTNVINYAYPGRIGPLKITLEFNGEELIINIQDKGKSFDPTAIPLPDVTADLEDRKIGGLGIYFMNKLMDGVKYSFDPLEGNKLTLRKIIIRSDPT